jgi:hypothetical protein
MTLRRELQVPEIDGDLVAKLGRLAAEIYLARPGEWEDLLDEFNHLSPQPLAFDQLQTVVEHEHENPIVQLLATHDLPFIPDLRREDLVAAFERIVDPNCPGHERIFLIETLGLNLEDPQISDLIYWPGDYFGDGDFSRPLTPAQMAEAALARHVERTGIR